MSLLEGLRTRRGALNPVRTRVTLSDGRTYTEERVAGETVVSETGRSAGFVVDTKPDLAVAHVLPGLFMGSQDVAFDMNILSAHSIHHILSLGIPVPHYPSIEYIYVDILDIPEFDLHSHLTTCFDVISKVRSRNENIYVHCNAGVSRSASVVIGYLMKENSWKFSEAYSYLKSIRPAVRPNDGFVLQLKKLENHLVLEQY